MDELREKAANYAAKKTNEVMTNAIAQAYADGYRDGYKDREEEIPVDLRDNQTVYVDLGLPSGTLWSADYEKNDDDLHYIPYGRAKQLNIPTQEQWEELDCCCKWEFDIDASYDLCEARCVGPNGNTLRFARTGKKDFDGISEYWEVFFWVKNAEDDDNKKAVHMYNNMKGYNEKNGVTNINGYFIGYKLPVRLVRKK